MKTLLKALVLVLIGLMVLPSGAQAQKKKKEKKPFVWELPKLTGNEDFDKYLLTCDTLYTRIQHYNDSITYYKVLQAETGQVDDTGKPLYKYLIVDAEGNARTPMRALAQYADFILTGTNIILDCTNLSLLTAVATTTLPSLGFSALSHAKYLKAGPKIVGMGGKEIKEIVTSCKAQAKDIRALKKSSTNTGDNKNAVMISSEVPTEVEIIKETDANLDKVANSLPKEEVQEMDDSAIDDLIESELPEVKEEK